MRALSLLALAPLLIGAASVPSDQPDAARLKMLVEKLVSFGTRHTLSSGTDKKRGIGAARAWAAGELTRIGKSCGGCLIVEQPAKRFDGPRAPDGVNIVNVLGIQRGTGAPGDGVIIAGHIDSRASDVMDAANTVCRMAAVSVASDSWSNWRATCRAGVSGLMPRTCPGMPSKM